MLQADNMLEEVNKDESKRKEHANKISKVI
jgi:hypothetical protein